MLISRYIFRNLLVALFFVALILTIIVWLTQSLRFLELIISSNAPAGAFTQLVFLSLPKFLEVVLPIALTAAVLFIYNKMTVDNELVVLRAGGISQDHLARPALTLAALSTITLLFLTSWLTPTAHMHMQEMRQAMKAQYSNMLLREGVFNTLPNGLTVYMRQRSRDGDLLGLMIHDARDKDAAPATITAKKGRLILTKDGPQVQIIKGTRQQIDPETGALSKLRFESYTLEIENLKKEVRTRPREPDERTIFELLRPDPNEKIPRIFSDQFPSEIHRRLTAPFLALNFAMIALAALFAGAFNRRGQARRILVAVAIVVVLQSAYLGIANWSRHNHFAIPFMYLIVSLPMIVSAYLMTEAGQKHIKRFRRKPDLSTFMRLS